MRRLAVGVCAVVSLVIAPAAWAGASVAGSPRPVDPLAAEGYSKFFGVSKATAERFVSWTDSASKLQDVLTTAYRTSFGGLWLDYTDGFQATVAYSGYKPLDVEAPADLLPRVQQVPVAHSLDYLISLASSIDLGDIPHATFVDVGRTRLSSKSWHRTRPNRK
jgi:hypothetical protein